MVPLRARWPLGQSQQRLNARFPIWPPKSRLAESHPFKPKRTNQRASAFGDVVNSAYWLHGRIADRLPSAISTIGIPTAATHHR
jgi:hypothetical protein